MKVTQKMIDLFREYNPAARNIANGLRAALVDVPDVQPFTFRGSLDNPVYIHQCGTVIDVVPGSETDDQVQAGECDCENTSPWLRIYVDYAEAQS